MTVAEQQVYVSICKAWVPRTVAERMVPLILEAIDTSMPARAAAEVIDGRLSAELGAGWSGDRAMIVRGVRRLRTSQRLNRVAQRLGPMLIQVIPGRARPWLERVSRPLAQYLAAAACRRKYGRGFVWQIHENDDLLHYSLDVTNGEPVFRYYRAVQSYFVGGEWNAAEVEKVLDDAGFPLRAAESVLEFACGYGRVTRHLVHRVGASKLTVSDIDRGGVDFVTEKLGVPGFYSASSADELTLDERFDVIVIVSLFSHLPIRHWGPWLRRLSEMLQPGGVLLFSVLGTHAWEVNVSDDDRDAFQLMADGFRYGERNETRGRLSTADYGMAYVTEEFVERAVAENFAGSLVSCCPEALNGFQDVYVLQRARELA